MSAVVTGAQDALQSLHASFDELAMLYPEENEDESGDAEEGADAPAEAAAEAVSELLSEISSLEETFATAKEHLESLSTFCEGEARAWRRKFDAIVEGANSLAQTIDDEKESAGAALKAMTSRLELHGQRLAVQLEDIVQRAETVAVRTREEMVSEVAATGQRFLQDLQETCWAPLESCHAQASANLQQTLQNFRAQTLQELKNLENDVESVKNQFLAGIRDGVQGSVRGATDSLVTAASERIASTITESVLMTQLGTQLSSAMAPILPQMIAINKAAEVIREAIKVFKAARMGF